MHFWCLRQLPFLHRGSATVWETPSFSSQLHVKRPIKMEVQCSGDTATSNLGLGLLGSPSSQRYVPWRCSAWRLCSPSPGSLFFAPSVWSNCSSAGFSATDVPFTLNSLNLFMQSCPLAYIARRRRPLHSQKQPSNIRFYLHSTYTRLHMQPYQSWNLSALIAAHSDPPGWVHVIQPSSEHYWGG